MHYFGNSIVYENNIPYEFSAIKLGKNYLLTWAHYYDVPEIKKCYQEPSDLFIDLCKLDYIQTQSDPNRLVQSGGNCQAFAIYVRTALTKMGYENGFIPYRNHVCNWVVLEDGFYRIDIVERTFTKFSEKELIWFEKVKRR